MVELGLVFTVIAVAIAGVLYAYHSVITSYKNQELVKIVQQGIAGIYDFNEETSHKTSIPNMQALYNEGYLAIKPAAETTYPNPLGGDVAFLCNKTDSVESCSIAVSFMSNQEGEAECNRAYAILSHMIRDWKSLNACNPKTDTSPTILFNSGAL
ncbi:MAG: hypothetical protein ACRY3E_06200 [Candidatus Lariskella arthropodorum]